MRRALLALALAPLVISALACGLGGEPCETARARRARAVTAYRAELERSVADWHERYDRQSRGEAQDTAAVSRSVLERYERDLEAVRRAEEAQARGDDAAADEAVQEIPYPMGAREAYEELSDADLAVRNCTP